MNHIQRELDFNTNYGSNPNNQNINLANSSNVNKFNVNPTYIPQYNNYMLGFSQTPQNGIKSFSFVNNNFPSSFLPINTNNNLIPFELKPSNSANMNLNTKINNHIQDVKFISKEEPIDFKINLDNIMIGKDKRTTIMLRNIPNKYTLANLVEEINIMFLGKIDYINLPIDYEVFKINNSK